MRKFTSPLEGVRVAAPCPADWERMVGDERVRFCGQCSLHVYNLSGMTKREAEGLVANAEGRLCVRYYSRADGSVLTRNCPVGLRALKRRVSRIAGAALSAVIGFFAGVGLNFGLNAGSNHAPPTVHTMGALAVPVELKRTPPAPTPVGEPTDFHVVTGDLVIPTRPVVGRMRPKVKDNDAAVPAGERPKHTRRD
jgi:hypothetical protein